jgi:autotransporter translocation and assembly factor TamB
LAGWALALAVLLLVLVFGQELGRFLLGRGLLIAGRFLHARVGYERVEGNPFSRPVVTGLTVALGVDSLRVERVALGYDLLGLVRRRFAFSNVELLGLTVFIGSKRPVPAPRAAAARADRARFPRVSLARLRIVGGAAFIDTVALVDSLDADIWLVSGGARVRAGIDNLTARLNNPRIKVQRLEAMLNLTQDSLRVDSLILMTRESRLQGDVRVRLETGGLAATVDNLVLSLPEFSDLPGRILARGSAGLDHGRLSGDTRYAAQGLVVSELALPSLSGRATLADSVLTFTAAGSSPDLGAFALDAQLDLRDSSFWGRATAENVAVRRLVGELPDIRVGARADFQGRGADSAAVRFGARIPALGIDSLRGQLRLGRGRLKVDWAELTGPVGRAQLAGHFANGRLAARCRLDTLDLACAAGLSNVALAGRISGTAHIRSAPESLLMAGNLQVLRLQIATVSAAKVAADFDLTLADRLHGRLAIGAESLALLRQVCHEAQLLWSGPDFELRLDLPKNRLRAVGSAQLTPERINTQVHMLQFATEHETLLTSRPFQISYTKESLAVTGIAARLAGATVEFHLLALAQHSPEISLRIQDLDIARLRELLDVNLAVSGRLDLDIRGSDTLAVRLSGRQVAVPRMELALATLELELHAARTGTVINHLKLARVVDTPAVAETSIVSGRVGYRLDHDSVLSTLEMDLKVDLRDPGIWVLSFLRPSIELPAGTIYGLLTLRGSFAEPVIDGRVRISRASLRVPAINTAVERLNVELTFSRNRIRFEKFSGRSSRGAVVGHGFLDLGSSWQVDTMHHDIQFTGATINPQPEIYAVAGGSIMLDWAAARPLVLSGTVDVVEALIAIGFGSAAANGGGEPDALFEYDVRVRAERGVWLRNSMVDIELGMDLTVRKTRSEEVYIGELSSRQGNVYYLDNTLRVTRGLLRFPNITRLNPELDIAAELAVRPARDSTSSMPEKVVLILTGTLEQPQLEFASEPAGWNEADIASYLSLSMTPDQFSALEQRDAVTRLLSQRLLSYFQTQAAKRARGFVGLDYLEIESGLLGGREARVTVGKYVGRRVYVTYTQNFTGDMQPLFRVEYYINRRNELVAERSDLGRLALRYRLKLRY